MLQRRESKLIDALELATATTQFRCLQLVWMWEWSLHLHKLGAKLSNWYHWDHTNVASEMRTVIQGKQGPLVVVES